LEAAMMAKNIPPGMFRPFACMQWPAFRSKRWLHWVAQAERAIQPVTAPAIYAADQDAQACRRLQRCVRQHDLQDAITVHCRDFFAHGPPKVEGRLLSPGLVVLNPPYGRRLIPPKPTKTLYQRISMKLRQDFQGWRIALILPHNHLPGHLPFNPTTKAIIHGGLPLTLLTGRIETASRQ
ncbi:MAG: hypothetical protein HKP58_12205, partial [Desulfatitalea sp.]|nr:hypothetical protein [Desulfatitalea sp.]NNK01164.1 hypothetical protein [Desulfatitalea sp.]